MDYQQLLTAIATLFGALDGASHTHTGVNALQDEFEPNGWVVEIVAQNDTQHIDNYIEEAVTIRASFYVDAVSEELDGRLTEARNMMHRARDAYYADQTLGGLVEWSQLANQRVVDALDVDGRPWVACQLDILSLIHI